MTSISLLIVGYVAYALAWLLPVRKDDFATYYGWDAIQIALFPDPSPSSFSEWCQNVLFIASGLSNFVLAGIILEIIIDTGVLYPGVMTLLCVCALLNSRFLFGKDRRHLRIGFYLWWLSFYVIALGHLWNGGVATSLSSSLRYLEPKLLAISLTALAGTSIAWMLLLWSYQAMRGMTEDDWIEVIPEIGGLWLGLFLLVVFYMFFAYWWQEPLQMTVIMVVLGGVVVIFLIWNGAEMKDETRIAWNKGSSVFWSGVLCLLAVAVALSQVTSLTDHLPLIKPWAVELVLPLFVVLLTVILVVLSLSDQLSIWSAIGLILIALIGVTPSVLVVLTPRLGLPVQFFHIALAFWLVIGVVSVARDLTEVWPSILTLLIVVSTIATVFCEVGTHSPIQFATQPLKEVPGLLGVIEIRLGLGVLTGGLCLITAVVRGFWAKLPSIWTIPTWQLQRLGASYGILAQLVNPFSTFFNGALSATILIANVLFWFFVALLLRVLQIGCELAKLVWQLSFQNDAMPHRLKSLLAMLVTFGVIIMAFQLSPHVREYLRLDPESAYKQLPFVGELALVVLIGAATLGWVIVGERVVLERVSFGATLLVGLLVLAGGALYLLAAVHIVEVVGFDGIGPISILGIGVMLVGVVAAALINVNDWRGNRNAVVPESSEGPGKV